MDNYFETSDHTFLHYIDIGNGNTTIFFVPGHMCTTRFFERNINALSKKYRVISYDPRGFGNSTKSLQGNTISRNSKDLAELIDFLNLENIILLGWSLGGTIVTHYAHTFGEKHLKGLGLIDCCLYPFSSDSWNSHICHHQNMNAWNEKYKLWYQDSDTYYNNFLDRFENLTIQERLYFRQEIEKTPPWIGLAIHSNWCATNAVQYLKDITLPVIIFSGTSLGHLPTMGNYYQTQLNSYCEHHIFEEGGHFMFYTKSDLFNQYLTQFIERICD